MDLVTYHITAGDTKYAIDKAASENAHRIVRLPPYFCQYNPIKLIWAQGYVSEINMFRNADLKAFIHETIDKITTENWRNAVTYADKLQADDAKRDRAVNYFIDSFIITHVF